jgi:hypothetical protein
MVARATSLDKVHPAFIAAVRQNAERQAVIVADYLDAIDERLKQDGYPDGARGLPPGFLLELGAVVQLKLWEAEGLAEFLPTELPTAAQAGEELFRRTRETPEEFHTQASQKLGPQVMRVWLERFAWAAPNLLQADVVLGEVDEDVLVDALAQLLWEHRDDAAVSNTAD